MTHVVEYMFETVSPASACVVDLGTILVDSRRGHPAPNPTCLWCVAEFDRW